ncbi:MAG TPA: hypothetical protein VKR06_35155 [Ktedonosporobacter sp.]|nr:hypothetical protein [Ktedonosporobacter sp.]
MLKALMKIRQEHHLTTAELAQEAGVPLRVAYLCEIGGWVDEEEARKVVNALSRLTEKFYTLEMLGLNLKAQAPDNEPTLRLPIIHKAV